MKNREKEPIRNVERLQELSPNYVEVFNGFENSKDFLSALGFRLEIARHQICIYENEKLINVHVDIALSDENIFLVSETSNGILEYSNDFTKEEEITLEIVNSKIIKIVINDEKVSLSIKNNNEDSDEKELDIEFEKDLKTTLEANSYLGKNEDDKTKNYIESLQLVEQILPGFINGVYKKFPLLKKTNINSNQKTK